MKIRTLAIACLTLSMTGCSLLSPVNSNPPSSFLINTVPNVSAEKHTRAVTLLVMPPESVAMFNTRQMAYTDKAYEISYFIDNQWAETPSDMLEPLIVQTLQKTDRYRTIVSPPYVGYYDYLLTTHIIQFEQDLTQNPSIFKIKIRADLTRMSNNRIIASRQFDVEVPIQQIKPYSAVIAANKATAILLKQLATFCTQHL